MSELVVIDGDTVAFRAAAMNERRTIIATHKPTGRKAEFDNRTALKEMLNGKWDIADFDIEDVQTTEELSYCFAAIKAIIKKTLLTCNTNNYKIILSGKDNFRLDLPLPTRYKSNRDDLIRPIQLNDARNYLINCHTAEFSSGCEADDVLVEYAWKGYKEGREIIQATPDKDAWGTMGYMINFVDDDPEIEYVSGLGELFIDKTKVKGRGRKWLYMQCLIGDAVDGFKPTDLCGKRFGDKSAYKILNDLSTDKQCWQAMVDIYKDWYPNTVEYKAWDGTIHNKDAIDLLQLYVDCAHMRRWKNDRIDVKAVLDKFEITY